MASKYTHKKKKAKVGSVEVEIPEAFLVTTSLEKMVEELHEHDPTAVAVVGDMIMHYQDEWMQHIKTTDRLSLIHSFQKEVDSDAEQLLKRVPEITCRKGCSHCCHISVATTQPEVDLIVEYMKGIEIDMEWLRQQQGMTEETHMMSPFSKCVFLNEQKECSIYDVRPISCRKYFVSSDPELCNAKLYPKGMVACRVDWDMEAMASALLNIEEKKGTLADLLYETLNKEAGHP